MGQEGGTRLSLVPAFPDFSEGWDLPALFSSAPRELSVIFSLFGD